LKTALFTATFALSMTTAANAGQVFDGYASVLVDALPNARQESTSEKRVTELRTRVFGNYRRDVGTRTRFTIAGFAEGLIAKRRPSGTTTAGIVRPQEVNVEARWEHADVRVGFSRVVWGRLDEFLPTDVVNPQDLTRFFLEGRTEGRMPVGMIRGRWLPSDTFSLEAIYVPVFRRGRFDQLAEDTAPFSVSPPIPATRMEPAPTLGNVQGGVRASATTGRVDWAISAYRGLEPLPVYQPGGPDLPGLRANHPRFTMIGGDFETVKGLWGVRGEIAAFVERTMQLSNALATIEGRSVEAGLGVDRKAGSYRVSGTVMLTARPDRSDVTLVSSVDRSFARETRSLRAFAVYNPGEESAFARLIAATSLRDNVSLEGSAGWFTGQGADVLARFADRDFLYARLKVFF
jgi:hypothetical protein